jgi:hypothetical protein
MLMTRNRTFLLALLCVFFIWDTTDGRPMEYVAPNDHTADTNNDVLLLAMKNREQILEQINSACAQFTYLDYLEFILTEEPTQLASADALIAFATGEDHLYNFMSLQL